MPIAIDPNGTIDYVLICDREKPVDEQTVFQLRTLKASELAVLEDNLSQVTMDGKIQFNAGTQVLKILNLGVAGWRNFKDDKGNPVQFNDGKKNPSEKWDYLLPEWRRELANAITDQTHLSRQERKN